MSLSFKNSAKISFHGHVLFFGVKFIFRMGITFFIDTWSRCTSAAKRSYPMAEVRGGSQEELPHVRGQGRWLRFAGAAVKRYPTFKVRETQVRW